MQLNIQVLQRDPSIGLSGAIGRMPVVLNDDARTVLLPDSKGSEQSCKLCSGSGRLTKGEDCRKCNGTGSLRAIEALRVSFKPSQALIPELKTWYEYLRETKHGVQVTVVLAEHGGGFTNTGDATIICGINGERLTSMYGLPKVGENHATFYVRAVLMVEFAHHHGRGKGKVSLIAVSDDMTGIRDELVWEFDDSCIGEKPLKCKHTIGFPEAAVKAAIDKSMCYHCRSSYYSIGKSASGPGGALTGAGAVFGGMPSPFKGPGIGYDGHI